MQLGRYELHVEIASGGMATIHAGRLRGPAGFARVVAVKRLHPQFAKDPEFVAMLVDEARLSSRVRHPNVVPVLDVVNDAGEVCIVMDYVHGVSLSALLDAATRRGVRVPPRVAAGIVAGALRGLHAAHEATNERGEPLELVHRDVSTQNIMVDVDGVARVVDFGIAKALGRLQATRDGELKGKLAYMAPEQLRHRPVTRRTDVYAATVVLWETLTGRRLFEGTNEVVVADILRGDVLAPSVSGAPPTYDAIVVRGLARDPARRFASALAMASELEAVGVASSSEIGAYTTSMAEERLRLLATMVQEVERAPAEPTAKPAPKSRRALVAVAMVAFGALSLVAIGRGRPTSAPPAAPASNSEAPAPRALESTSLPGEPAPVATSIRAKPTRKRAPINSTTRAPDDCDSPAFIDDKGHVRYKIGCPL